MFEKVTMPTQEKLQAQKRPAKTISLHLRLTLGTETFYNNQINKTIYKTTLL